MDTTSVDKYDLVLIGARDSCEDDVFNVFEETFLIFL